MSLLISALECSNIFRPFDFYTEIRAFSRSTRYDVNDTSYNWSTIDLVLSGTGSLFRFMSRNIEGLGQYADPRMRVQRWMMMRSYGHYWHWHC